MKPYKASLLNGVTLIALGTWGYLDSTTQSFTALIPVFTGIIILSLNMSFSTGNKATAHIIVVLTFLIFIALFKPLAGAIDRKSALAILRVFLMIVVTFYALAVFVKSFIDARKSEK